MPQSGQNDLHTFNFYTMQAVILIKTCSVVGKWLVTLILSHIIVTQSLCKVYATILLFHSRCKSHFDQNNMYLLFAA